MVMLRRFMDAYVRFGLEHPDEYRLTFMGNTREGMPYGHRGEAVDPRDRLERMHRFHDAMLEHYLSVLNGPAHVLDKMTGLWGYWVDAIPGKRKPVKRLCKTTELDRYRRGVEEVFGASGATAGQAAGEDIAQNTTRATTMRYQPKGSRPRR